MPHKGKNKGKRSFNIAAELRELQRNQGLLGIQTHKPEFANTVISNEGLWQRLNLIFMYLPLAIVSIQNIFQAT